MNAKIFLKNLYRESTSFLYRSGEKIKDKFFWTHTEIEEAISYLIYFRNYLKTKKEKNINFHQIFGESGEFFEVKHFKKGFNTKSITFKTIVDDQVLKWVLKIGHRISLTIDFGDPSTEKYSQEFNSRINILKNIIVEIPELSHLLPAPEEVLWAVLKEENIIKSSTLILQPFFKIKKNSKLKRELDLNQKRIIIKEIDAFKKLCDILYRKYKLRPDLLGEGNLEIVNEKGEYHLKLLDEGFLSLDDPIPITQTLMHFATLKKFFDFENNLKS